MKSGTKIKSATGSCHCGACDVTRAVWDPVSEFLLGARGLSCPRFIREIVLSFSGSFGRNQA